MYSSRTVVASCVFCVFILACKTSAQESSVGYKIFKKLYDRCSPEQQVLKCIKIQALKVADRALYTKSLTIANGIAIVANDRTSRGFTRSFSLLNETKLQKLAEEEIDDMLTTTISGFLDTHKLTFNIPKIVEESEEEARRRKDKGHGHGNAALLWALAIKGSFLAMAYKGIAIMAGTALIVGKMALLLSAILGLKKLVSSGHEKTTFEIVKHPKYSETHTHSSSYEDEGHYRRAAYEAMELPERQEKVYRAYVRK